MSRFFFVVGLTALAGAAFAQQQQGVPQGGMDPTELQKKVQEQIKKVQLQNTRIKAQNEAIGNQIGRTLKESDPKFYAAYEKQESESRQARQTIKDFREGKIDEETARRQLRPYVKNESSVFIKNIDKTIAQSEKRLADLKRMRDDPDLLIDRRVDAMLGKGQDPAALMGPMMAPSLPNIPKLPKDPNR